MDDGQVQAAVDRIMQRMRDWLETMVADVGRIDNPRQAAEWERRLREQAQGHLAATVADAWQAALDARADAGRCCPGCGGRRRHKGRRGRTVITSVGEVRLEGIYWACPHCGRKHHDAATLIGEDLFTTPMRELVCLLGVTQSGFAHAATACRKLLGVSLSTPTIAAATEEEGRRAMADDPASADAGRLVCGTLVGSCDGTSVNTREAGWRELKAYRFDDDHGRRLSGAALEPAERFMPRLRELALSQHAEKLHRFVFVSDAAEWIRQGVAEHLPEVSDHIVDLYHAYQHIHTAARQVYGEGSDKAGAWAKRWCDELYTRGGKAVWDRLRRARFKHPDAQAALDQLLGYLNRHKDRMDYPRYRREKIPISSGPMESTCKQLGLRLKGPGMRWRQDNLTPMATLISLWNDQHWNNYWQKAA